MRTKAEIELRRRQVEMERAQDAVLFARVDLALVEIKQGIYDKTPLHRLIVETFRQWRADDLTLAQRLAQQKPRRRDVTPPGSRLRVEEIAVNDVDAWRQQ